MLEAPAAAEEEGRLRRGCSVSRTRTQGKVFVVNIPSGLERVLLSGPRLGECREHRVGNKP
jgi:hypothetical protein